eukprot:3937309-Rhodomonas_salina.1
MRRRCWTWCASAAARSGPTCQCLRRVMRRVMGEVRHKKGQAAATVPAGCPGRRVCGQWPEAGGAAALRGDHVGGPGRHLLHRRGTRWRACCGTRPPFRIWWARTACKCCSCHRSVSRRSASTRASTRQASTHTILCLHRRRCPAPSLSCAPSRQAGEARGQHGREVGGADKPTPRGHTECCRRGTDEPGHTFGCTATNGL